MDPEPRRVFVNGIHLAYERTGSGYPLLLIHGFPRDRRLWRKLIPRLNDRFTTVAYDRRGYGDSDRPADAEGYTNRVMADDALGLADSFGWDKFMVLGHDLGAPVAQRLAADHPGRVSGLVMLDALPQGAATNEARDTSGRGWYMEFHRQRGVAERLIGQNARLYFSLFLARHAHLTPAEHEMFLEPFCRPGSVAAVLADYRHLLEGDRTRWQSWFAGGRRIAVPACVLWAGRGPIANTPVLDVWREIADNVRGAVIPGTAHYLQEEQPLAVADHVRAFADEQHLL